MRDVPIGVRDAQIIVSRDGNTPFGSVDLIRSVFGPSDLEAFAFAATSNQSRAVCVSCPPEARGDMLFIGSRLNVRLPGGADGRALRSAADW